MEIPSSVRRRQHSSITSRSGVSPACIAHNSAVRHDIVTTPNEPANPPSHLALSSLAMPLYPANPEFFLKVSVSGRRK
ncbi:hypothetical protein H5410_051468 [Solanum commersonii]|uniref:Uncharacterized protein n=1 Tax=Solanum commersonii TaxID=4109 RepID=A0A9J5WY95_SOLCO|nr:hypothetical protein H5410_051468 [Solanum commersonii]